MYRKRMVAVGEKWNINYIVFRESRTWSLGTQQKKTRMSSTDFEGAPIAQKVVFFSKDKRTRSKTNTLVEPHSGTTCSKALAFPFSRLKEDKNKHKVLRNMTKTACTKYGFYIVLSLSFQRHQCNKQAEKTDSNLLFVWLGHGSRPGGGRKSTTGSVRDVPLRHIVSLTQVPPILHGQGGNGLL
jgi:hypothetical protein